MLMSIVLFTHEQQILNTYILILFIRFANFFSYIHDRYLILSFSVWQT